MRRRKFITLVGSAAATWPFAASAQHRRMPAIGYLGGGSPNEDAFRVDAFRKGLKTVGYVEGQNVTIEYRWAEGQYDRFPSLAAELVRRRVDVITALGATAAAMAAKQASSGTIPVVFATGGDPVKLGLVMSLNRPMGNLTGVTALTTEVVGKRADLLHETVPKAGSVGFLVRPKNTTSGVDIQNMQAATSALGQRLMVMSVAVEDDLKIAFENVTQEQLGGLMVATDVILTNWRVPIVALAAHYALPAVYPVHEFTAVGGLMSYGPDLAETYSQCGVYAGRILKGEKAADLPVVQSTKFELVVNLKTAKALGLEIPSRLLATADEVIE
jgi:putative ABC transport system substrate-binding protein